MEFILTREHKDSWSGIISYETCQAQITPELNIRGEVVTGLETKEARELEVEMGMSPGQLAPNSDYWISYFIPLKGLLKLDDTIPSDKVRLSILRHMKKVAIGRDDLKKKSKAIYLLTSKELEAVSNSQHFDVKERAWELYFSLSAEKAKQVAVVLEKEKPKGRITDVSSMDAQSIKNQLRAEVERDPKLFTTIAEDEDISTKFEILDLVTNRVLSTNSGGYYHKSDLLGSTLEDAVHFFKEVHNQPRVIQIKKEAQTRKSSKG